MFPAVTLISFAVAMLSSSSSAAPEALDWKVARGWDGVVSSPTSIGTPLNGTAEALGMRAASTIGGIFICEDGNWGGICGYAVQPLGQCIVLGGDWNNKISSIGPDAGTLVVAYDESNCAGTNTAFVNPGTGDLGSLGWNDRISSFKASRL